MLDEYEITIIPVAGGDVSTYKTKMSLKGVQDEGRRLSKDGKNNVVITEYVMGSKTRTMRFEKGIMKK